MHFIRPILYYELFFTKMLAHFKHPILQVYELRSRGAVHPTVTRRPRSSLFDRPQSPSPSPSSTSPHVTDGPSPSRYRGLLKQIPRFVLRPGRGGWMEVAHQSVATDSNNQFQLWRRLSLGCHCRYRSIWHVRIREISYLIDSKIK